MVLIMVEYGKVHVSSFHFISLLMSITDFCKFQQRVTQRIQKCVFRFDNIRIPRENLLNSVADVSPDGQYLSAIKDPDQVVLFKMDIYVFLLFSQRSSLLLSSSVFSCHSEICSILGSINIWSCNNSSQCNLLITGNWS